MTNLMLSAFALCSVILTITSCAEIKQLIDGDVKLFVLSTRMHNPDPSRAARVKYDVEIPYRTTLKSFGYREDDAVPDSYRKRRSLGEESFLQSMAKVFNVQERNSMEYSLDYSVDSGSPGQVIKSTINIVDPVEFDITLKSPNYPLRYPDNARLSWVVECAKDYVIKLSLTDAELVPNDDFLTVYDGASRSTVLGTFSGSVDDVTSFDLITTVPQMLVEFQSNDHYSGKGFELQLRVAPKIASTISPLKTITTTTLPASPVSSINFIQSPNYPDYYDNDNTANWNIVTPEDTSVHFTVVEFSTQAYYDVLYLFNYHEANYSYLLDALTGQLETGYSVSSTSNVVYLEFTADLTTNDVGFYITYEAIDQVTESSGSEIGEPCTGEAQTLNKDYGFIISDNYPDPYGIPGYCVWWIHSSHNTINVLTVLSFDVVQDQDSFIAVDGNSNELVTWTGSKQPGTSFCSQSNFVLLIFDAGGERAETGNTGFLINFEAINATDAEVRCPEPEPSVNLSSAIREKVNDQLEQLKDTFNI